MLTDDDDDDAPGQEHAGVGAARGDGLGGWEVTFLLFLMVGAVPTYAVSQWLLSRSLLFAPVVVAYLALVARAGWRVLHRH